MVETVSVFGVVRCPKCFKLLTEFTDIPVYKCGACSTVLHDKDKTSLLRLECKHDKSIDKNMNFLHNDEEIGNQWSPGQLRFDNSKSEDHLKSSSNPQSFAYTLEGNAATVLKPKTSRSFCCSSSRCSSCVYNINHSSVIENFEKLRVKDKKFQARRQCRPVYKGAPFIICSQCFELLRLPIDFFISKSGSNKLQCGACSKILVMQFPAKYCSISNYLAHAKSIPQMLQSSQSGNSLLVRNSEQELLPPLHQLMGYFSATEVLYQVTDVEEGYQSSEPAMPDSYRRYEEERHKKLLQCSEDEAYFGSGEVEEDGSSKILSKREQSQLRSLMNGFKRIDTWGSKARG